MLRDALIATAAAVAVVTAYLISEAFPPSRVRAPDQALRSVLDRRIVGEVGIRGSLRDAIDHLVSLGCPIDVLWQENWPYVDQNNRVPIDLRLRGATVEQWLDAIEFQIGRGQSTHWVEADGRIKFAALRWVKPPAAWCLYDVRDLIEESLQFESKFPRRNVPRWPEDRLLDRRADAADALSEALKTVGGPYPWNWEGGGSFSGNEFGLIRDYYGEWFAVMHTPEVHRRVEVMLAALRARR